MPSRLVGSSEPTSGCPCEQVWHGGVGRGSPAGAQAPSTYGVLTSCVSAPHLGPPLSPCAGWVPRSPTGPARLSLEPRLHAQRPAWTMVSSLALGWGRGSLALRAVEVWKPQSLPRGRHAGQAEAGWAPGHYPQRCVWGCTADVRSAHVPTLSGVSVAHHRGHRQGRCFCLSPWAVLSGPRALSSGLCQVGLESPRLRPARLQGQGAVSQGGAPPSPQGHRAQGHPGMLISGQEEKRDEGWAPPWE